MSEYGGGSVAMTYYNQVIEKLKFAEEAYSDRIKELEGERDEQSSKAQREIARNSDLEARLSEAVKVLEPLVQYLEDDDPILASDIDMLSKAKAFLATIGEENEA